MQSNISQGRVDIHCNCHLELLRTDYSWHNASRMGKVHELRHPWGRSLRSGTIVWPARQLLWSARGPSGQGGSANVLESTAQQATPTWIS